jgi:hypothetical protein
MVSKHRIEPIVSKQRNIARSANLPR